jgi:hypothetical protein
MHLLRELRRVARQARDLHAAVHDHVERLARERLEAREDSHTADRERGEHVVHLHLLGEARCPCRALRREVGLVHQHDRAAARGEVERGAGAQRAGSDDDGVGDAIHSGSAGSTARPMA